MKELIRKNKHMCEINLRSIIENIVLVIDIPLHKIKKEKTSNRQENNRI